VNPDMSFLEMLDVLNEQLIARGEEPVAFDSDCREGICGMCSLMINGVAHGGFRGTATCQLHMRHFADGRTITVEPWRARAFPVIRDLVTDMREFFDKWARAKGQFRGEKKRSDDFARISPASERRKLVDAAIECIGCAVCYSACDVAAWNPDYLGPAALNRAWTLLNDERDAQQAARLRAVAGDAGCHSCHTHMSCTDRCPKALSPTAGIAGLKRAVAAAALKGGL